MPLNPKDSVKEIRGIEAIILFPYETQTHKEMIPTRRNLV